MHIVSNQFGDSDFVQVYKNGVDCAFITTKLACASLSTILSERTHVQLAKLLPGAIFYLICLLLISFHCLGHIVFGFRCVYYVCFRNHRVIP